MRIGFFTDSYDHHRDGIAHSAQITKKALEELGHEVIVFCPKGPDSKPDSPTVCHVAALPSVWYEGYRDSWIWQPQLWKQAKAKNLDVVHIHTPFQIGWLGMKLASNQKLPVVLSWHTSSEEVNQFYRRFNVAVALFLPFAGLVLPKHPSPPPGFNKVQKLSWLWAENVQAIVVPSEKIRLQVEKLGTHTPIHVIPTGLEERFFVKTPSVPQNRTRFMVVNRLVPEKNIGLVIKAFAKAKLAEAELVIIGGGPQWQKLSRLVKDQGVGKTVHFWGSIAHSQVFKELRMGSVYVLASTTDTQGLGVFEAVASGKPLILVDQGLTECFQPGKNGLLAKNSPASLAEAMQRLAASPGMQKRFGMHSLELAKRYTTTKQSEQLTKLYQSLVRG
jgi:glycosyltransferase involved in cell wall biosynthesis